MTTLERQWTNQMLVSKQPLGHTCGLGAGCWLDPCIPSHGLFSAWGFSPFSGLAQTSSHGSWLLREWPRSTKVFELSDLRSHTMTFAAFYPSKQVTGPAYSIQKRVRMGNGLYSFMGGVAKSHYKRACGMKGHYCDCGSNLPTGAKSP